VETTTKVGLAVMCLSLSTGAGGGLLVKHAHAIAAPPEPARRALIGTVTDIVVEQCGNSRPKPNCYRPVVTYTDPANGRQPQTLVSRTGYRPKSPHNRGERVTVYIESGGSGSGSSGGTAWLASEWDERQAERQRRYADKREFPLVMGWMLVGCAGFGVLLGAGLIFWVDRSGLESKKA
jgi:hypothetical protein